MPPDNKVKLRIERSYSLKRQLRPIPLSDPLFLGSYLGNRLEQDLEEVPCCCWLQRIPTHTEGQTGPIRVWEHPSGCNHAVPGMGTSNGRAVSAFTSLKTNGAICGWIGWLNGGKGQIPFSFRDWWSSWYLRHRIAALSEAEKWGPVTILGESPMLREALVALESAARNDLSILLEGETGTGKELFARSLHLLSQRRGAPFQAVNCAMLTDDSLALSELFGHRKGSFTGAMTNRQGLFRAAEGGTLFLDELQALSLKVQGMLLRAVEYGEIQPLGQDQPVRVNVRLVTATNRVSGKLIQMGLLREDLYFRLKGSRIMLPPLRERGSKDILHLAATFLQQRLSDADPWPELGAEAMEQLLQYKWPGNVRELRSVMHNLADQGKTTDSKIVSLGQLRRLLELSSQQDNEPEILAQTNGGIPEEIFQQMVNEGCNFWKAVKAPFMTRELKRSEVQAVISRGLATAGSYKGLLELFNLGAGEYKSFMNFLQKNDLHPADGQ